MFVSVADARKELPNSHQQSSSIGFIHKMFVSVADARKELLNHQQGSAIGFLDIRCLTY
jgi:hypothetical protein